MGEVRTQKSVSKSVEGGEIKGGIFTYCDAFIRSFMRISLGRVSDCPSPLPPSLPLSPTRPTPRAGARAKRARRHCSAAWREGAGWRRLRWTGREEGL